MIAASTASESLNGIFTLLTLWLGSLLVIDGTISPGKLLTFYALTAYCTGPVKNLVGSSKSFQNARIAADRLLEIFHLEPESPSRRKSFPPEKFGDMVLSGVSFSYGKRKPLLRDVDLRIPTGQTTMLTGSSGSGKTTLASLLRHIYPPDSGRITLNGLDSSYFHPASIRALIGVVDQRDHFLSGSLLENLAPGETDPDLHRMLDLMHQLGLSDLLARLPAGLESSLHADGRNLSGGEKRKLSILRAVYSGKPLLIFDEPGNSLDDESAGLVYKLLLKLKKKSQTQVILTHQEIFYPLADRHYHLSDGKLTLLNNDG
jgi:ATP-binding cassette subfamily B protein